MQSTDLARDHARARVALTDAAEAVALDAWDRVDPERIVESWSAEAPSVVATTAAAQQRAATAAEGYLDALAKAQGVSGYVESRLIPQAFVGGSSGRSLAAMIYQPVIGSLLSISAGADPPAGLSIGRNQLSTIVRTQVADAGRTADGVALTAHRAFDGYVRVVVGATCSRCVILAGVVYRWNAGFQRHPRCDCVHMPTTIEGKSGLTNPQHVYDSLSPEARQQAGWSKADQKAIGDGADLNQVTNAHRGVYTAGGRTFTREGTTKRGFAGKRAIDLGNSRVRLTPEQIYAETANRGQALQQLYANGYLLNNPLP